MRQALLALLLLASPAMAQHPPEHMELHDKFYSTWTRPDMPNVSCCGGGARGDCYPTEARYRDGEWYALHRETQRWIHIPQQKIEYNRDSPDGRNHACISVSGTVFCFIAGAGG